MGSCLIKDKKPESIVKVTIASVAVNSWLEGVGVYDTFNLFSMQSEEGSSNKNPGQAMN